MFFRLGPSERDDGAGGPLEAFVPASRVSDSLRSDFNKSS